MTIKGLTGGGRSFDCIGHLRKGGPKIPMRDKQGREVIDEVTGKPKMTYGPDLDHFRFTSDDSLAVEKFRDYYGEAPRVINIRFPYPTAEENFFTAMEEYDAGGLVTRCDREFKSSVRVGGRVRRCFPGKVLCDGKGFEEGCGRCKEVARLTLIIPELERFVYVTSETHSINDIVRLDKQLADLEHHFGRVNGIPLILTRRLCMVSTPGKNGKRARRPKWLLSIEVAPQWASRQLQARDQFALQQAAMPQLGAAPDLQPEPAAFDTTVTDLRPEPLPTYDFTKTELWVNMTHAFHNVDNAQAIEAYQARAFAYIDDGTLPAEARTMIINLAERAYQKLSDRQPPPAPKQNGNSATKMRNAAPPEPQAATSAPEKKAPQINLKWKKSQLWLDLHQEVQQAPKDELPAFIKQVEKLIANDELPPAAGPAMQELCNRRAGRFDEPALTVTAEVIDDI